MQRALASADSQLPVSGFYEVKDLMAATVATQRIEVALLTALSSLALLLSAVGIFALVANIVAQRTEEIGIRMALGSTVRQTMIRSCRQQWSGRFSARIGAGADALCGRIPAMRSVLYGDGPYDAPTMLAVVLTLGAVTLLATTPS